MELNQAVDVDLSKNLALDLCRVIETAAKEQHDRRTPPEVAAAVGMDNQYIDKALTDLDHIYVIDKVNELLAYLQKQQPIESRLFRILLRHTFASKQVVFRYKLSKHLFDRCISHIKRRFIKAGGVPGDPVGPLSSHSISEPATQLTLNTFHSAGTS